MKCMSCGFKGPLGSGTGSTFVVGRRDECPQCHADLHACIQCLHHDPKSYNECMEPQADSVKVKDRSNFCDYFLPNSEGKTSGTVSSPGAKSNEKEDLLKAAEALFKKN